MFNKSIRNTPPAPVAEPDATMTPEPIAPRPAPRVDHRPTPSTLGPGLTVEGSLRGDADMVIEGRVRGDVEAGRLVVGAGAVIEGNIRADAVEVRGRIVGDIEAQSVTLMGSASVEGDITHGRLSIEMGADFEGRCKPIRAAAPAPEIVELTAARGLANAVGVAKAVRGVMEELRERLHRLAQGLDDAKRISADGRKEVDEAVASLGPALRGVGAEAAAALAGRFEELDRSIGQVAEAEVAVAVVRSGVEGWFSAGADLREFLERSPEENLTACRRAHQVLDRFAAESPLFIAAIAGHALGGGYEIALACDIRVAAEGSYRIGLPEVTLGLLPGTGGTQRLPRLIGRGRALELMTTGRTVTPAEAERLGMVDRLVPAATFDQAVAELAAGLAAGAPLAIAAITRVVNDGLDRPLEDALVRELEELDDLFASEDAREGMTAFTEKRPPKFSGR